MAELQSRERNPRRRGESTDGTEGAETETGRESLSLKESVLF